MRLLLSWIIMRGTVNDWYSLPLFAAILVASLVARYRRFFVQWLDGIRGRDWAAISAVIDVVSVVQQTEQVEGGERVIGYLATLTYFYRNPKLQMGEYSRMFATEDEGQAWAASYKGRAVMVHVNPRDAAHSILRKEDL